ncbi:MAG: zinc-dependent peptidase [Flavipsychrobacter sp.]|nr:zinc-dependent peptidase [Flavipsychrobacter sp.]
MPDIITLLAVLLVLAIVYFALRKPPPARQSPAEVQRAILEEHITFYQQLSNTEKERFAAAVRRFLSKVRVTGVNTEVEPIDEVFVAAAAIIPIFAFKDWEYKDINEVLLYPVHFSKDFRQDGDGRNVLGMVGTGAMEDIMILSRQELRNGFFNKTGRSNTAIHEFVHIIDKMDGDTDGWPEALLPYAYARPWLQHIYHDIRRVRAGKTDIDPYGATSEAEFFAVVSEYFFKQPERMQDKHPELYKLLNDIFTPGTAGV